MISAQTSFPNYLLAKSVHYKYNNFKRLPAVDLIKRYLDMFL